MSGPVTTEPTTGNWSTGSKLSINKVLEFVVVWAANALVIIIFSPNINWKLSIVTSLSAVAKKYISSPGCISNKESFNTLPGGSACV